MTDRPRYPPIEHYAAVGDCHGGALVCRDGSVDWCCLERFDADPLFCRLLDADRGGFLSIAPSGRHESTRAYLPQTNILATELRTATGRMRIVDLMPVGRVPGARANDYVSVHSPGWLVRRIEILEGTIELDVECRASRDFGARPAGLRAAGAAIAIEGTAHALVSDLPLAIDDGTARARVSLPAGERRFVVVAPARDRVDARTIDDLIATSRAYWREWAAYCRYHGPYRDEVVRSALALKMMTFPATGACVAAFTSSLPERIGGERNWDYRYCWIRDATLMLHALCTLGYSGESQDFFRFLCERLADGVEKVQVVYGLAGERDLAERAIDLAGYRDSRPVRTVNAAHSQDQIDLYGYLLEGTFVFRTLGGSLTAGDERAFAAVADFIEGCWFRPDTGIWETRGAPRHFTHSKAMCWIVLDRAIRMFGAKPQWVRLRDTIWQAILEQGRDAEGSLRASLAPQGPGEMDAALLQLAGMGLPLDLETLRRTRRAVEHALTQDGYLRRYRTFDGMVEEGAFLACNFWHVDALLAEGELDAAIGKFEQLLGVANDVGLYSEEYDPVRRSFLGNFPQAFTHFSLVNSAVGIELCRKHGAQALRGGYAERARRYAKATLGYRAVAAALLTNRRVRIFSSRRSQLDPARLRQR